MKTNHRLLFIGVFVLICGLLFAGSARAQITGINAVTSSAVIQFLDNNSFNAGNPGSIYNQTASPWNGSTWSLSQTDPTTLDFANGDIAAIGAGNSYSITLNNVVLTQPVLNTGFADLNFQFTVEYNIGGFGLPSLPTSYPNFLVSGTVQTGGTGYASILGSINYYGVDASGVYGLVETVNYNWLNNTPGVFNNVPVNGVPVNGTTPAFGPNTIFDIVGNITFQVDPATLNVETVPEPGTLALAGLSVASLFAFCRRLKV
jgi:hypothetical protein